MVVLCLADSASRNLERGVLVAFYFPEFPVLPFDGIALWVADSMPEVEPLPCTVPWPPLMVTGIPCVS